MKARPKIIEGKYNYRLNRGQRMNKITGNEYLDELERWADEAEQAYTELQKKANEMLSIIGGQEQEIKELREALEIVGQFDNIDDVKDFLANG